MNITMVVSNAYHPDPRVHKEATFLVASGHQVSVLCWDRHREYPDQTDVWIDGVRVVRFLIGSTLGSGLKQLPAYAQFMARCGAWMKAHPADAVHAHDLDGMLIAARYRVKNVPITFDMHEYYEYTSKTSAMRRPLIRWLVNRMVKIAKTVLYVHPAQLEHLSPSAQAKAVHLPNYPDEAVYLPIEKTASQRLRIGYIGKIRQYEQLKNVLEAAQGLAVDLRFHGDGVDAQRLAAAAAGNPHALFTGRFSAHEVGELYRNVDLMIVLYDTSTYQYRLVEPVKFYEAILTQTPLLVEASMDIASLVQREGLGFVVDGRSIPSIRQTLVDLLEHPEKLALAKTQLIPLSQRYRWNDVVQHLSRIYPKP
jgi:glycosyltransferase involved in cell wall biosynthesis